MMAGDNPAPSTNPADWEATFGLQQMHQIRSRISRIAGSSDEADDLLQEALLVTIERSRRGEVREPTQLAAFMLGVATNVQRNRFRRLSRETPISSDLPALEPEPGATDRETALRSLVDRLSLMRDRNVLTLHLVCGVPTHGIAKCEGVSTEHVYRIISRAKARLRVLAKDASD